jgi:hypothetical protein
LEAHFAGSAKGKKSLAGSSDAGSQFKKLTALVDPPILRALQKMD